MSDQTPRSDDRGQILVIVAVGLIAFLAMVALVIDGGHAWGRQRDTQNGTDAAAEAGAVLLAQNLPFKAAGETPPNTDAGILAAVQASMASNGIAFDSAEYTTFEGAPIGAQVGANGGSSPPATAEGVRATAHADFDTFIAGVIGFDELTARSDATAVAGYLVEAPGGSVLPVTLPVTVPFCDKQGDLVNGTDEWVPGVEYTIALCKNEADGNVGWLDWDAGKHDTRSDDCKGNGASELACSIRTPNNPPMTIPGWFYVAETGNTNSGKVQAAMEYWIGKQVMIPIFDATCSDGPLTEGDECTAGPGHGQGTYYHFTSWISLTLTSVHIQGSNAACGPTIGGNGGSSCFKGTFGNFMGPGVLGGGTGEESILAAVGTQLIE